MYGSLENIQIITLAPELDKACDVIRSLTEAGVTVSVGHSMGDLKNGEDAVKCGATFITHLFNAMLPVKTLTVTRDRIFCIVKDVSTRVQQQ